MSAVTRSAILALGLLVAACGQMPGSRPTVTEPAPQAKPPVTAQEPAKPAWNTRPTPPAPVETAPLPPSGGPAPGNAIPPAPVGAVPTPGLSAPAPKPAIRVALLVPLSGRAQAVGQNLLEAAQIAVFDHASEGFKLLPFDTEKDGATAAANAAVAAGAHIILGPLFSNQVSEVAPIAKAAGLSVISFSNDRSVAQTGVYTLGLSPVQALQRVLAITHEKGATRYAALVPDSAIGRQTLAALEKAAPQLGSTVVRADTYPAAATDFQGIVRRTAEYDRRRAQPTPPPSYQVLVLAEAGARLKQMGPWIPYYDIDVKDVRLVGPPAWDDTTLGAEPGLVGGWYAAPDPAARGPFEEKFKAAFGATPNRIASLAYDAVALTAVIGKLTGGPNFSDSTLTNPNGFAGVEGLFRLNMDGSSERGLAVWEIQRGQHKQVAPAPGSFLPPAN